MYQSESHLKILGSKDEKNNAVDSTAGDGTREVQRGQHVHHTSWRAHRAWCMYYQVRRDPLDGTRTLVTGTWESITSVQNGLQKMVPNTFTHKKGTNGRGGGSQKAKMGPPTPKENVTLEETSG